MKKILFLLSLGFILLLPSYSHATSGACSYHGGVNCSAGATFSGNAICKDGSVSSVRYSSMFECMSVPVSNSCILPVAACSDAELTSLKVQLAASEAYGLATDAAITDPSGYQGLVTIYQQKIDTCQQQVNTYNTQMQVYNSCIAQQDQQTQSSIKTTQTNSCVSTNPNSSYNSTTNSCVCNQGYTMAHGSCQTIAAACTINAGINSHVIQMQVGVTLVPKCICNDGYISGANGQCVDNRQTKTISQKAYQLAQSNQSCKVDPTMTSQEVNDCVIYQANPNSINWQVIQASSSVSINTVPVVSTTTLSYSFIFTQSLAIGSHGKDVTPLQNLLIKLGLLQGSSTGYYGTLTAKAVKLYQSQNGIPQTGTIGPLSRQKLNTIH